MPVGIRLDIYAIILLLGSVQGLFLFQFFLGKQNRKSPQNVFQGLLILALSLLILDIFLGYSGYMQYVIHLENFSEPLNFFIGPVIYLFVKTSINNTFRKRDLWHFSPFIFYFIYSFLFYLQPADFKLNSFLYSFHPELPRPEVTLSLHPDPLKLRAFITELSVALLIIYFSLSAILIFKTYKKNHIPLLSGKLGQISYVRTVLLHLVLIIATLITVKIKFDRDLGDYLIATYLTFLLYYFSFSVIKKSQFFEKERNVHASGQKKYHKSTLTEERKTEILQKLTGEFEDNKYYLSKLAGLNELAKKINESHHNVSQVINEKLNKNFFELLAEYRIKEASDFLKGPDKSNLTIEEIAEMVGYNSKTAFNNAFKKLNGITPSEYRNKQK